ncbi:MAG: ABC transporter ATP-binding protein [Acetobacteraceae bacterium]
MATLTLNGVRKQYEKFEAIKGVDLAVTDREFVVFVGPSGCGKSTLLRMIAGLEEITAGDLLIDGVRANDIPPDRRGLAMVFQSYALYPHMTVAENMGFALRMAGVAKAEIAAKVGEAARILQLEKLLDRRPGKLSGGQRQRVAIGRAIVRNPKAFLFDEPLSNLDAALRVQMRIELARLHQELNATTIYVTHDQIEAMTMADRIVVLNAGKLEQVGSPLELYSNPANIFVAGFIGAPKMNLIDAKVAAAGAGETRLDLGDGTSVTLPGAERGLAPGTPVVLGLRPETLSLAASGPFRGTVRVIEYLGGESLIHIERAGGDMMVVKTGEAVFARLGESVSLAAHTERASLFTADGKAITLRRDNPARAVA